MPETPATGYSEGPTRRKDDLSVPALPFCLDGRADLRPRVDQLAKKVKYRAPAHRLSPAHPVGAPRPHPSLNDRPRS